MCGTQILRLARGPPGSCTAPHMVRAQLPALWALLLAAGASGWGARSASPPPPAPLAQQQLNELLQTAWAVGVTEGELRVAMESRGTGGPSAAVAAITTSYRQAPCAALLFDANPQSCAEAVSYTHLTLPTTYSV